MPTLPKYGSLEGCAVRWLSWEAWELGFDGTWHEISAADVVTKARVLTEEEYHRLFGPVYQRRFGPVPPLPDAAFRTGWRSSLV